jgi:hypothetical protein
MVDIDPGTLLNKNNQTIACYTFYSEIELDNATAIALILANKVYSHAVITINIIINTFLTNINPFMYNITSYYTSIKFIGVMIDTKAFKHSTVGYSQFLIL